jgi:hypothetical protein
VIPPGDHAFGAYVQSLRHFFERQQAFLAKPIIPRFDLVFTAEARDDSTVESLPATVQQVPDPSQPSRSIVPEWLLDAWQAQGLQFDRTNHDSVRRAFATRAAAC